MSGNSLNWDSILKKLDKRMNSSQMKKAKDEKVKNIMFGTETGGSNPPSLYEIGDTFAAMLYKEIVSSSLHPNVEDRLIDTRVGEPQRLADGSYMITVSFDDDLDRQSMSTLKDYGYDVNLAELYNNGVDHMMEQIFERRGARKEILLVSNTVIGGAGFAEKTERKFKKEYGKKYNIIRIEDDFGAHRKNNK